MIGHINVSSLSKKTSDIQLLLKKHGQLQILGITETRLQSDKHDDNVPYISEYTFLRKDATEILHTGIGVYIHDSLISHVKRRPDLEKTHVESMWLELRPTKERPILIGFIYRNPKCKDQWFSDFEEMLHIVHSYNLNTILMGDFNINLSSNNSNNELVKKWNIFVDMFGLDQLISEPTRVEKRGSIITSTLIDHIYVNCKSLIDRSFISDHSISDHKAIICSIYLLYITKKKK